MKTLCCWAALAAAGLVAGPVQAELIQVGPGDDYSKIESAGPGDIVEIAPGTYQYRVMLTAEGTAAEPIVIRAQDPGSRPVWDLDGQAVGDWPGSYTAGDKGRGCWQVKGSHYQISGIEFHNCQDQSSAGLRAVNCGPLAVRDCRFVGNTNGLTGASEDLVVEHCEFDDNGQRTTQGAPTHNIYIYGGVFTLRYSYVHDPYEGQNLHIRAHRSVIEYNWIARPASYPMDIMTCGYLCGGSGNDPITQTMLLRGNVILQGDPQNASQFVALYDDAGGSSDDGSGGVTKMELTMVHNTVVGKEMAVGKTHNLVNMRNDSVDTAVRLDNNIFFRVARLAAIADHDASNWSVEGTHNWIVDGTYASEVHESIVGTHPGFVDLDNLDLTLAQDSPCLDAAAVLQDAPDKEYYRDESLALRYKERATTEDLGAFEWGNIGAVFNAYGQEAGGSSDGGVAQDGGTASDGGGASGDGGAAQDGAGENDGAASSNDGGATDPGDDGDDGCGCGLSQSPQTLGSSALLWLLLLGLLFWRRQR